MSIQTRLKIHSRPRIGLYLFKGLTGQPRALFYSGRLSTAASA